MKALTVSNPEKMIPALQEKIRRSQDARYSHRLHAILLVAQGVPCYEVAELLGKSPRTIHSWVHRFEEDGFAGLFDAQIPGRPRKLANQQLDIINKALRKSPMNSGFFTNIWDGRTLSAFIRKKFGIEFSVRQSQKLFHKLGFRLRKPRPVIAKADPELKKAYKKNSLNCCLSRILIYGRWMRFSSNSMVRAAGCGLLRKKPIL